VKRVSVVGNSGSGKSTLARALATRLGVPHIELDALNHQSGWQRLPAVEFRERIDTATAAGGWVVDGNYSAVRDLVWARADTVAWLDPPRRTVMRQVVWRSVHRVAMRVELWNGNRERWRNLLTRDPTNR
jgi:adenylate kinase family enzyme